MSKPIYLLSVLVLFLILVAVSGSHDVNGDEDENEDEAESEIGENLGSGAIGLLGVGSIYIFIRRGIIWYSNYSRADKELARSLKMLFAKYRPYLLLIHQIFMVLATIFGLVHGLLVEREFEFREIFGWLAEISMIVISILGLLMWNKLRPLLRKIDLYTPIRFVHRQWILSVILAVFLILHVGM